MKTQHGRKFEPFQWWRWPCFRLINENETSVTPSYYGRTRPSGWHKTREKQLEKLPNHQWWYAKWKLIAICTHCHTCFCTFGADFLAQPVLINKTSASEFSRKFIKVALLVGYYSLLLRYIEFSVDKWEFFCHFPLAWVQLYYYWSKW